MSKIECKGGKTKQSMRDECNINVIMRRYKKSGQLPLFHGKTPVYGDFSTVQSYQESLDVVQKADALFRCLPAALRRKLENNPGNFLAYVRDEKNREEMQNYGLIKQTRAEREIEKVVKKTEEAKKNETV